MSPSVTSVNGNGAGAIVCANDPPFESTKIRTTTNRDIFIWKFYPRFRFEASRGFIDSGECAIIRATDLPIQQVNI